MSYRLRYEAYIDWVGDGQGPMGGALAPISGMEAGGAQTLKFVNSAGGQNVVGAGTGGAITSANVSSMLSSMQVDLLAQMTSASTLARMGGFISGGG